jgi:AcrR family transcriptional regulator
MAGRRASRDAITREQWAAHLDAMTGAPASEPAGSARLRSRRGREPLSVERIVQAALETIERTGFDALTMRSVATALDTGPASLYAHVRNKAELGDLLLGELCSRVERPDPDPARWQDQFAHLCRQLRDELLRYPGVARATLAVVPSHAGTLRLAESMLAVLLAGDCSPREAAWVSDTALLYITAYCLEAAEALHQHEDLGGAEIDAAEIADRLRMLPEEQFPHTVALAGELTAGGGHDRFDFAIRLLLRGVAWRG